jgi:hypothetical protein
MGRGKGWCPFEALKVAEAYVRAPNDPILGADQKGSRFWTKVQTIFAALSPDDCPAGTYKYRKVDAIKVFLKEHVFPQVNKFNISLRLVNAANLTGNLSELQKINIAVAIHLGHIQKPDYDYKDFESSDWKYFSAWYNVLRKEPKWMPTGIGRTSTGSNNARGGDSNSSGSGRGEAIVGEGGPGSNSSESEYIVGEEETGSNSSDPKQEALTSMPSRKRGGHPGRDKAKKKVLKENLETEKLNAVKEIASALNNADFGRFYANQERFHANQERFHARHERARKIGELEKLIKMTKKRKDEKYRRAVAALENLLLESADEVTHPMPAITFAASEGDLSDDSPVFQL